MSFESGTEQSDVESIGSRTHICETELGSDEDEEDMYYSDPEGPYIDEPIADVCWIRIILLRLFIWVMWINHHLLSLNLGFRDDYDENSIHE